jgi:hypothetical protein
LRWRGNRIPALKCGPTIRSRLDSYLRHDWTVKNKVAVEKSINTRALESIG